MVVEKKVSMGRLPFSGNWNYVVCRPADIKCWNVSHFLGLGLVSLQTMKLKTGTTGLEKSVISSRGFKLDL